MGLPDYPWLGEIRMFSFDFVPQGWAKCDGQILPINQNQGLYSLFHTMYGGDGRTTFGLPDLRCRVPVHVGGNDFKTQGAKGGAEQVTLDIQQIPNHTHQLKGTNSAFDGTNRPEEVLLANAGTQVYGAAQSLQGLHPATVASVGYGDPHNNMQPFLTISFCVCVQGSIPPRN